MHGSISTFEVTSAQRRRALITLLRRNFGEENTIYLLTHYDQALLLDRVHLQRIEQYNGTSVVADHKWSTHAARYDYTRFSMPAVKLDLEKLLRGLDSASVVAHDVATIMGMDPTVAMLRQGIMVDGEPAPRIRYSEQARYRTRPVPDNADDIIEGFVRAVPRQR